MTIIPIFELTFEKPAFIFREILDFESNKVNSDSYMNPFHFICQFYLHARPQSKRTFISNFRQRNKIKK